MSENISLTETQREARRQEMLAEIPSWYKPGIHMLAPTLTGIVVTLLAISFIHAPQWYEFLTLPISFFFANLIEWVAHKEVLHKYRWWAPPLYNQHVPRHHVIYTTDDMGMRDPREMRLVLMPAYAIFLFALITLPISLLLYKLVGANVAALFMISGIVYGVGYEWLHLSYHLPKEHPVARLKIIQKLKWVHALHHDPRLMRNWNMNITVPLADWLLGSLAKTAEEGVKKEEARRNKMGNFKTTFQS